MGEIKSDKTFSFLFMKLKDLWPVKGTEDIKVGLPKMPTWEAAAFWLCLGDCHLGVQQRSRRVTPKGVRSASPWSWSS